MRYLANENIPLHTVSELRKEGVDISSVQACPGCEDKKVMELGYNENRILITFDKDFGELVFKMKTPTRGVILLRYTPKNPEYITQRLKALPIPPKMDFENHFCTVTEEKVRLVKLSSP